MFATNTSAEGRYHTKWLNMMYPRLYLARNLLSEDGVIFISIDDRELSNLRKVCDEIFGEENLVANIIWQHSVQPKGYTNLFLFTITTSFVTRRVSNTRFRHCREQQKTM